MESFAEDIILYKNNTTTFNNLHESIIHKIICFIDDNDLINLRKCNKTFLKMISHKDVFNKKIHTYDMTTLIYNAFLKQNLEFLAFITLDQECINNALAYSIITHKNKLALWLLSQKIFDVKGDIIYDRINYSIHHPECESCLYHFMTYSNNFNMNVRSIFNIACEYNNLYFVKYLISNFNIGWTHKDIKICFLKDSIDVLEYLVKKKGYRISITILKNLFQRLGNQNYWWPLEELLSRDMIRLGPILTSYIIYYASRQQDKGKELIQIALKWAPKKTIKHLLKQAIHNDLYSIIEQIVCSDKCPQLNNNHFKFLEYTNNIRLELILVNKFEMQKKTN